jgi:hypothetical protein
MHRLSSQDRDFFRLVSRAAFSNPFSQERDDFDRELAELPGGSSDLIGRVTARVATRLNALERRGRIELNGYGPDDAELLEHAILFHAFHEFTPQIDTLIHEQLHTRRRDIDPDSRLESRRMSRPPTPESGQVHFADRLFQRLQHRSVPCERTRRVLELFYQMRRAHHFISGAFVGTTPSMIRVRESLWNNVFTYDVGRYDRYLWNRMEDFATFLVGETGTGKTSAASAIGRSGFIAYDAAKSAFAMHFDDLFVPVNLSEFSENLVESEVFGHRKGAFTGAVDTHEGWLSRCVDHGVIFLDEIGDLSPSLQVKLLRVLQERTYAPVGGHERRRFAGRVVSATHRPLDELRAAGRFRDDFYFRVCSDRVELPPLRTQLAEDPALLSQLVEHITARILGGTFDDVAAEVTAVIERDLGPTYPWTGNVRELEQCVRRVLLTDACPPLSTASPRAELDPFTARIASGTLAADEVLSNYCASLYEQFGSYTDVAARAQLDPRTVKKYVLQARANSEA